MSLQLLIDAAVKEGAIICPHLKFEKTEFAGISAFIDNNQNISSDPISIELPNSFIIKPEDAFKALGIKESEITIDENIVFKFYLACIKLNHLPNDKFKPYIDLLPSLKDINSPLSMHENSLYVFDNTSLQKSYIIEKLEALKKDLKLIESLNLSSNLKISFDDYLWSHLIITSRAFPYRIINPAADPHLVMLLPIIDLLNHKPNSKVEWSSSSNGNFKFSNLDTHDNDKDDNKIEIFNNYGPKSNAELLMGYGFVLEDNEFESLQLSLSLGNELKENLKKQWNVGLPTVHDYTYNVHDESSNKESLNSIASSDTTVFMLNKFHPIADGLLELFSFINKNSNDKGLTLKNVMNGLNQLKQSLEVKYVNKLDKIPTFNEVLISSYNYANAKLFRQGQLKIYNLVKNEIKNREKQYLKEYRKYFITIKDIFKKDNEEFGVFIEILQWDKEISELSKMEMELILRLWLLKTINYWNFGNIHDYTKFDIKWFLELFNSRNENLKPETSSNDEFMVDLYNQIIPVLKENVPELILGEHWELNDWLLIDKLIVENSYEKGKTLEPLLVKPLNL